jgi:hypothetical protein
MTNFKVYSRLNGQQALWEVSADTFQEAIQMVWVGLIHQNTAVLAVIK